MRTRRKPELVSQAPVEAQVAEPGDDPVDRSHPPVHPAGREPLAAPQPEPVRLALQPGGVGHADLGGGQHLLPHPRHAEEQGGLDVAQVRGERLAALAEVHDVADVDAR